VVLIGVVGVVVDGGAMTVAGGETGEEGMPGVSGEEEDAGGRVIAAAGAAGGWLAAGADGPLAGPPAVGAGCPAGGACSGWRTSGTARWSDVLATPFRRETSHRTRAAPRRR
jgi:hypothetical protein